MEFILRDTLAQSNEWVFLVCLGILSYLAIVKVYFSSAIVLQIKGTLYQKYSNQFLRDHTNLQSAIYFLPLFILVFSLLATHPEWTSSQQWQVSNYLSSVLLLTSFLAVKFAFIYWIGHLVGKTYLFEEILFQSFVFEKVAGIALFPVVLLAIYSPIDPQATLVLAVMFFLFIMLFKWTRMLYLSFFKASFSNAHIIVYLCIFEILPFLVFAIKVY